ncbi:DUF4333 domain-containing protein [Tessaracoccus sp. Y36]
MASLGAIAFGVLALRRLSEAGSGKKRGIAGIVVGALALPLALISSTPAFEEGLQQGLISGSYDKAGIESEIQSGLLDQADITVTVDCPSSPTIAEGSSFECVARERDSGTNILVEVRIQDDAGSYIWEVLG